MNPELIKTASDSICDDLCNLAALVESAKEATTLINGELATMYQLLFVDDRPTFPDIINTIKALVVEIDEQFPETNPPAPIVAEEKPQEDSLQFIAQEIKNIKEQLKEFKSGKTILDIIEDIENNEQIRKTSEEYLFEILKRKYPDRVKWLNEKGENFSDHDFEVFNFDDTIEYYIECKSMVKDKPTFYMTKNEWRLFLNHTKNYQIYLVINSFCDSSHIFIDNLLDWLLNGKIVPYLKEPDMIKEEQVFLTLID
jgi:hypothetical protein